METIIQGRKTHIHSVLADFEALSPRTWKTVKESNQIPDNFFFLVGIAKYPRKVRATDFKFSGQHIFVQNMFPHQEDGKYRTRGYGKFWALHEPEEIAEDDIVLDESAIYQTLPGNRIKLIFANGEHRQMEKVKTMLAYLRKIKGLQDFSMTDNPTRLYEVAFKTKSCGYFLKDRVYQVWATPVGIPDEQSGEVAKGWLFFDTNCGLPGVLRAEREQFVPLPMEEGSKIGLYTFRDGNLVYER